MLFGFLNWVISTSNILLSSLLPGSCLSFFERCLNASVVSCSSLAWNIFTFMSFIYDFFCLRGVLKFAIEFLLQ